MSATNLATRLAGDVEAWLHRNPVSAPLLDDEREELAAAIDLSLTESLPNLTPHERAAFATWLDEVAE